jgi:hypothetical protein
MQWLAEVHGKHASRSTTTSGCTDVERCVTDVIAQRRPIVAYTAGHTHRHRVGADWRRGSLGVEEEGLGKIVKCYEA